MNLDDKWRLERQRTERNTATVAWCTCFWLVFSVIAIVVFTIVSIRERIHSQ